MNDTAYKGPRDPINAPCNAPKPKPSQHPMPVVKAAWRRWKGKRPKPATLRKLRGLVAIIGLVALVGQVEAQVPWLPTQKEQLGHFKPEVPEWYWGPFHVSINFTIRGHNQSYIFICFDHAVPWNWGSCATITAPAGRGCEIWRAKWSATWYSVPCNWRDYGDVYVFPYTCWVSDGGGHFWNIGYWDAKPINQANCPADPIFWDSTSMAGRVPTCGPL